MLKAFTFFLIPLYTSYLTTEEYGVINLAAGFYGVAATIVTMSLHSAVIRFYADYKDDKTKVKRLFGTTVTFILLVCAVFTAVLFIFKDIVTRYLFEGIDFFPVVLLSICIAIVSGLYSVYQDIIKGMQQAKKSVLLSYVFFFMMLGGNILCVVVFKMKGVGVLLSALVTNAIMVIVMFIDLSKSGLFCFCIDRAILKNLLKYSLPLVPHTLSYSVSNYASKVIINSSLSTAMLGIYSLASQLGNIADVILNSVQSAFQPWLFETLNSNPDGKKQVQRMTGILMWVYGLIFIGLSAYSKEVILIMSSSGYAEAWLYVPLIVVSIALKCPLYFINGYFYFHKDKTKYIFKSTLIYCIVNVAASAILIPRLGIIGSIISDIFAMFVRTWILFDVMRREDPDFYSMGSFAKQSVISIVFIALAIVPSYFRQIDSLSWGEFFYKAFIVLVYCGVMILANKDKVKGLLPLKKRQKG